MNTKAVKSIRKVERPRPLKFHTESAPKTSLSPTTESAPTKKSLSDVLNDLDALHINISGCIYDETTAADITKMCNILKSRGHELDLTMKEQMDRYFVTLRNASREESLNEASRLRILEVIEMRAMAWRTNENIVNYYKKKLKDLEDTDKAPTNAILQSFSSTHLASQSQIATTSAPLMPSELIRSSGKFAKPTKIAGKNYYKDEVVIRNSDSGKVNQGARDRLVQITGPHEQSIGHAKVLLEDTIRRNASPIRDKPYNVESDEEGNELLNANSYENSNVQNFAFKKQLAHSFSMSDATLREYCQEVAIGSDTVRILGTNFDLVKTAQLVLLEFFTGQAELNQKSPDVSNSNGIITNENTQRFKLNKMSSKNDILQSKFNYTDESRASISPLDSSSEDGTFREPSPKNVSNMVDTHINNIEQEPISSPLPPDFPYTPEHSFISSSVPSNKEQQGIAYSRDFLINCSKSPLCRQPPVIDSDVAASFPFLLQECHIEILPWAQWNSDRLQHTSSLPSESS